MVSVKMDGIRCLALPDGRLVSRTFKEIPNRNLLEYLHKLREFCIERGIVFDGELWHPELPFNKIISAIMSQNKNLPDGLSYYIFDVMSTEEWNGKGKITGEFFLTRYKWYCSLLRNGQFPHVRGVGHDVIMDEKRLMKLFEAILKVGGEGLMLRRLNGYYKHGRCTIHEDNMLKLKLFVEEDAQVIGWKRHTRIDHERVIREYNEFGHPKSVHRKGERIEVDAIGSLEIRLEDGRTCFIGGFDERGGRKDRYVLWKQRDKLIGRWVRFKHMAIGAVRKPRMGVFLDWRDPKEKEIIAVTREGDLANETDTIEIDRTIDRVETP